MSVERVLDTAAEILSDPAAWTQGRFTNGAQAFCSQGAILEAQRRLHDYQYEDWIREYETARDMLRAVIHPSVSIACWNDNPDRQHIEVLQAFEKARALAAEKGL